MDSIRPLLSAILGALLLCAAAMQWVRAPSFFFFGLGLVAQEWMPYALLLGLVGLIAAWPRPGRQTKPPFPRFTWAALSLNGISLIVLIGSWSLSLATPIALHTNLTALETDAWRTSFSLSSFLARGDEGVRIDQDLPIAVVQGDTLRMDVYRPQHAALATGEALVVIHGGSWRGGDKGEHSAASRYWASRGYVVFDVTYRFAPEHRFPAAVSDVKCALGAIGRDAERWQIDPSKKVLIGRSAGAQIALLAAYTDSTTIPSSCDIAPAHVLGVVSYYAPTRMSYYDIIQPELSPGALDDYLGGSPEDVPDLYRKARPFTWIQASTPATLLIHGARDQFVRTLDALELGNALSDADRPYAVALLPTANHGFDLNFVGTHNQRVQPLVDVFLDHVLSAEANVATESP